MNLQQTAKQIMQQELAKNGYDINDTYLANGETDKYQLARLINTGYSLRSIDYQYKNGKVRQRVYEAYCWLWRNMTYKYDSELIQYEGQPVPNDCYGLCEPYFQFIPVANFLTKGK